jgi:hypothetical protein
MNELVIRPSDIAPREVLVGELVDEPADDYDGPGLCRGAFDGTPCDDYRCCISS